MLNQKLSQKMLQKLSPQQIQLMKLLQIPTASLEQRIKEEMEANPALEEGEDTEDVYGLEDQQEAGPEEEPAQEEDFELDDYINEYIEEDPSSYRQQLYSNPNDQEDKQVPIAVQNSFHEYLESQLGLLRIEEERRLEIAHQIIGSIDNDGYLRRDPISIIDDLMFSSGIECNEDEIEEMIQKVQQFEPPGIGARNLQESLLIQIDNKLDRHEEDGDLRDNLLMARKIISDYFNEFSKKHYVKLQKMLELSEQDLREAIGEILKLNPKPASGYSSRGVSSHYVVPDFIIVNRDGELELSLNTKNAPELRINDQYRDMLISYKENGKGRKRSKKEKEAIMFIKQKIDAAKWFVDAIKQRQNTMYKTMYTIMQYQYDFFLTGDSSKLKPMILKDIADITNLDISTISRVASSKFVQTEFGTRRLKSFFF